MEVRLLMAVRAPAPETFEQAVERLLASRVEQGVSITVKDRSALRRIVPLAQIAARIIAEQGGAKGSDG